MKAPQAPIHDQRGASRQPLHQRHARRLDRQTPYLGFSRGGAGGLPRGLSSEPHRAVLPLSDEWHGLGAAGHR
jgi:hypothetical protein